MDQGDLTVLLARWRPLMRNYFARRTGNPQDVEDLVHDAICEVLKGWPGFAGRSSPTPWMYGVCRHVWAHFVARAVRHRVFPLEGADLEAPPGVPPELALVLEQLTPEFQRLYHLHYLRGLSVRETAAVLRRPEGSVKYLLHELRKVLREQWL